jgi:hypothetical protein
VWAGICCGGSRARRSAKWATQTPSLNPLPRLRQLLGVCVLDTYPGVCVASLIPLQKPQWPLIVSFPKVSTNTTSPSTSQGSRHEWLSATLFLGVSNHRKKHMRAAARSCAASLVCRRSCPCVFRDHRTPRIYLGRG